MRLTWRESKKEDPHGYDWRQKDFTLYNMNHRWIIIFPAKFQEMCVGAVEEAARIHY